jgi:biopolymer transport protein ExbB
MQLTLLADPVQAMANDHITTWFDLLLKGGIIMIPIFLLSLIAVYIFVERYSYLKKATAVNSGVIDSIIEDVIKGDTDKAISQAQNIESSIGRIMESGLSKVGKPVQEVESFMESTTNLEITKMEKDTGYLGIIAGIAPMLGFVGTISGVIKIFYNISLADNISIGIIAGGLYQKMICSGAGLIVGVIAYSAYHYLHMKIDRYTIDLQENLIRFLKVL